MIDNGYFWDTAWEEYFHLFTYFWTICIFNEHYYFWVIELKRIKTKVKCILEFFFYQYIRCVFYKNYRYFVLSMHYFSSDNECPNYFEISFLFKCIVIPGGRQSSKNRKLWVIHCLTTNLHNTKHQWKTQNSCPGVS